MIDPKSAILTKNEVAGCPAKKDALCRTPLDVVFFA
jgi:hypothetical protein